MDVAFNALAGLFVPERLLFLVGGVLLGLLLGTIPGLGGLAGLALLIPFTYDLESISAFAMLMGMLSVISTADTIPAVLFGVPGTTAAQATIMDGFPLAKKGQAGRALGAAYSSSLLGGWIGAAALAIMIPILRPFVLALGPPELFMMGVLGLAMVGVLSGRRPIKGIVVGLLGLAIGTIGMDPQTGVMRWTFGKPYLWDGVRIVPLVLGLFALPEIVDLLISRKRISGTVTAVTGVRTGVRDVLRHWFLVLRSSLIGVWVGAIPGLGPSVVDWFAYGHAAATERDATITFGKGDIRGVIAPESSNNSVQAGALIPTIAFGIPGSASMAILLGVLVTHGVNPGIEMLTTRLDLTFSLVWSIALANLFGAGICLALTPNLAKVASLPIRYVAPVVIGIVYLAAYQSTRSLGDLWTMLAFTILGWLMKRFGWPRPPLILGFVLSSIVETYLYISINLYGLTWFFRPGVLILAMLIAATITYGTVAARRSTMGMKAGSSS